MAGPSSSSSVVRAGTGFDQRSSKACTPKIRGLRMDLPDVKVPGSVEVQPQPVIDGDLAGDRSIRLVAKEDETAIAHTMGRSRPMKWTRFGARW